MPAAIKGKIFHISIWKDYSRVMLCACLLSFKAELFATLAADTQSLKQNNV